MVLVKENREYEARGSQSVQCLYYLEKKYAALKQSDKLRFGNKVA
jgi:hypothetical protein